MRAVRARCLAIAAASLATVALWLLPAAAQADFGFLPGDEGFKVTATAEGGKAAATLAGLAPLLGGHRRQLQPDREILRRRHQGHDPRPAGRADRKPDRGAEMQHRRLLDPARLPVRSDLSGESCPGTTQIGTSPSLVPRRRRKRGRSASSTSTPPPGFPARFGFAPYGVPITVTPHIREANREYGLTLDLKNFSQQLNVKGFRIVIWGTPWAISHNAQRGNCLNEVEPGFGHAKCPISELKPPAPDPGLPDPAGLLRTPLELHRHAPTPGSSRAR